MTTEAIRTPLTKTAGHPEIRHVAAAEPLAWLRAGWRDFAASPGPSLLYGVGFALACLAVVGLTRELPWFTLAFLTGLLVIGPVLASGLYAAARQMEAGERPSIGAGLRLLYARRTGLALFGVLLALIMAAWVRLSALLFAVKFDAFSPSIEGYLALIGGAGADPVVAAYFALVGLALAATVFVTSAVAVPAILDRDADPFSAIRTSARAVARNWPAMLLWAGLIAALTAAGIASLFLAMVVIFPILGYATWHSYRAMVR